MSISSQEALEEQQAREYTEDREREYFENQDEELLLTEEV